MDIIIPGKGYWNPEAAVIDKEVNEYDERLSFRRNKDTGDWCIYISTGRNEVGYPILGFGQNIPEPGRATMRLWETDTMRHGEAILRRSDAHNDAIRKEREAKSSEAAGELAEGLEVLHRKEGTHPIPRIFVPKGI